MIAITKSQVPECLRNGAFYRSLKDNDEDICVPKDCFKTNMFFHNPSDLRQLLSTLHFWMIDHIPPELIRFAMFNKIDAADAVFAEIEGELSYMTFLRTLSDHTFNSMGKCDYMKYLTALSTLDCSDVMIGCAKLCCLQFENSNGLTWNNETCELAAEYCTLPMLQWLHEHGCPWDAKTCKGAAGVGRLDSLKYAHENGCAWDASTCSSAARCDSLDCLQYAHDHGCPWDVSTCIAGTSVVGRYRCFEYAREKGCPWGPLLCTFTALRGNVPLLKQIHEDGCPWDSSTCCYAAIGRSLECLQYAHESGCPWGFDTCEWAAASSGTELLQYAHENGCPWNADTCANAAQRSFACLKYAHENGCPWDERTCANAAGHGNLDALTYAHENGCPWDASVTMKAAYLGQLDTLQYAHEHGCPWDESTCAKAAEGGQLACLTYAHENDCPWDETTCASAAAANLDCLRYAHEQGCRWSTSTCTSAAANGNMESLKYAHENGCSWDSNTCTAAVKYGHLQCLIYAHEHGCPLDGVLYEHASKAVSRKCIEYAQQHKCYPKLCARLETIALVHEGHKAKFALGFFGIVSHSEYRATCGFEDVAYLSLDNPVVPVLVSVDLATEHSQGCSYTLQQTTIEFDTKAAGPLNEHGIIDGARAYLLCPSGGRGPKVGMLALPAIPLSESFVPQYTVEEEYENAAEAEPDFVFTEVTIAEIIGDMALKNPGLHSQDSSDDAADPWIPVERTKKRSGGAKQRKTAPVPPKRAARPVETSAASAQSRPAAQTAANLQRAAGHVVAPTQRPSQRSSQAAEVTQSAPFHAAAQPAPVPSGSQPVPVVEGGENSGWIPVRRKQHRGTKGKN